mgnify:CR=1 FL=1
MIITTTPTIEGKRIKEYKGLVFGEVVSGANFIRDFFASITDVIGGRSGVYESKLNKSRQEARWNINLWVAIRVCLSWLQQARRLSRNRGDFAKKYRN